MASSHVPGPANLDLVRLVCGDPTRVGPGYDERTIESSLPQRVRLEERPLLPGSYGNVPLAGYSVTKSIGAELYFFSTAPQERQTILSLTGGTKTALDIKIRDHVLFIRAGETTLHTGDYHVRANRWYRLQVRALFPEDGRLTITITALPTNSPGEDALQSFRPKTIRTPLGSAPPGEIDQLFFAASQDGERFDGRIARPRVILDSASLGWDFAQKMGGREILDISGNSKNGLLYQLPARGVTGPDWNGSHHAWPECPSHYDAVHFHSDDLYDAGWPVTAELALPENLRSGIYAFRVRSEYGEDRVPFFVRPAKDTTAASVALLMPSCTYMAYANHRMLFEGADFIATRKNLRPEHEYIRLHPEVGPSTYEKHTDGSGVMFSSRLRPILQLRPGADGWNFTPDTDINAYLERSPVMHDILSDEDLHQEGFDALKPYTVIVTGTHPEYWSTKMLNGLDQWLRNGGRLMYLGGNGFYWRVAFNDAWPGAIELRRAEDGVRNWQTKSGESYHAFTGEYGGLWRRLGKPPNAVVGIGFAAQGFERAIGYKRRPESYESRAAWIFDGVDDDEIGTSGLGGGAAGQEVDRYSRRAGSPSHAVILASATDFGPDMTRTKEELQASTIVPTPDPVCRADMVFFETSQGGAVFSVGSISWFGALARNDYDNDVARITTNVIQRFIDPKPFTLPTTSR